MTPETRRWLVLILIVGAALRFFPVWFGLPYVQARPDERVAIRKGLDALNGRPNPHFFHWPSLTFYIFAGVLHVAQGVKGVADDTRDLTLQQQALVARSVVALAGTTTVLVIFLVGRRVAGDFVGLTAALFLAVAPLHVRDSHFAMTDVLMTLFLWLSLLALCDAATDSAERVPWHGAAAGLLAGLATSTKYNAAAVAAAMIAVQVILFLRDPRRLLSLRGWLPCIAFGMAAIFGFVAGTPYAIFDFQKFSDDVAFDFTHLSEGHEGVSLGRGWIYHVTHSLPYGVGVPVFVAMIAGLVPLLRKHRAAVALVAFAAAFYASIGSGYTVFFRYVLPLVPFVCVSAAAGLGAAAGWMSLRWPGARTVVVVLLLASTAGPALAQSARLDLLLARTDTRVLAAQWLRERMRNGDSLHDAGSRYTRLDLSQVRFQRVDYDAATDAFMGGDGQPPDWLLLHESPLTNYTSTPPALWQLAQRRYQLVHSVRGGRISESAVYDRQDAFFLPIAGFSAVERPGPTIHIYQRGDNGSAPGQDPARHDDAISSR
jgi:hypothetical protein